MAGGALIGLGATSAAWTFYFFYFFNALGTCVRAAAVPGAGPRRWFDRTRGKVMGIAYLALGVGGRDCSAAGRMADRGVGWRASCSRSAR